MNPVIPESIDPARIPSLASALNTGAPDPSNASEAMNKLMVNPTPHRQARP